jgi:hypothetical protein
VCDSKFPLTKGASLIVLFLLSVTVKVKAHQTELSKEDIRHVAFITLVEFNLHKPREHRLLSSKFGLFIDTVINQPFNSLTNSIIFN